MNNNYNLSERGQSLVFFAILSVAGLIFLALIIDGGGAYAMRRLAQNAADAGALAGARDYCITGESSVAYTTAKTYAEQNNLARLGNVVSQVADVTVTGPFVHVVTNIVYDTFFARILGMDQMTAVAEAEAGCFAPGAGEGVIPVAWECRTLYDTGIFESDCELEFMNPLDDPLDNSCDFYEDPLYIFLDLDENDPIFACDHWPESDQDAADYVLDCGYGEIGDVDNPLPLIEIIDPYHPTHGWMWANLDGGGGNESELTAWVSGDSIPDVKVHTWVPSTPGKKVATYTPINNLHINDVVVVPVFDDRCISEDPKINCWDPVTNQWIEPNPGWHSGLDDVPYYGNGTQSYYHLATFALLEISCVDAQGFGPCSARDWLVENNEDVVKSSFWSNVNSFEGCFRRGFHSGLIGRPSDGTLAGAWTIYLTK